MKMTGIYGVGAAVAVSAILIWQSPLRVVAAPRENERASLQTLIEKDEIKDMLVDYYSLFGNIARADWGAFYATDAVFDVNGIVRQGREPINALYKTLRDTGNIHILITNQKIVVNGGASATVSFVWTDVISKTHLETPQIVEQGHEQDELVKQDGRWYFAKRVVTSDGGMPAALEKSYKASGRGSR